MAALPDRAQPHIVDLRTVHVDTIGPLLEDESRVWRDELDWDFSTSADLVRRFIHMQALNGFALLSPSRNVSGYSYYVCEEGKGLIGDLFVDRHARSVE